MFVNLSLGRQRQDDGDFQASLSYLARPCLKNEKEQKSHKEA
jgi:hypothetical protein